MLHIWALHVVGQNNPTGLEIKDGLLQRADGAARGHEGYLRAGGVRGAVRLVWCSTLPDYLGHADNYIEANPLSTPPHIVPQWYFLPYYAILRAIPNKLLGVIAMFSSIILLCFAPWLDTSRVRSAKYRRVHKWFFWLFIFTVVALGYSAPSRRRAPIVTWGAYLHGLTHLHALPDRDADRRGDGDAHALAAIYCRVGAGQRGGSASSKH